MDGSGPAGCAVLVKSWQLHPNVLPYLRGNAGRRLKAFLDELKRRNVIRVGGIYLVAGWILMQAAALLEDALSMPAWFDIARRPATIPAGPAM